MTVYSPFPEHGSPPARITVCRGTSRHLEKWFAFTRSDEISIPTPKRCAYFSGREQPTGNSSSRIRNKWIQCLDVNGKLVVFSHNTRYNLFYRKPQCVCGDGTPTVMETIPINQRAKGPGIRSRR